MQEAGRAVGEYGRPAGRRILEQLHRVAQAHQVSSIADHVGRHHQVGATVEIGVERIADREHRHPHWRSGRGKAGADARLREYRNRSSALIEKAREFGAVITAVKQVLVAIAIEVEQQQAMATSVGGLAGREALLAIEKETGAAPAGLNAAPVIGSQREGERPAAGAGTSVNVLLNKGRTGKIVGHDVELAIAVHILNSRQVVATNGEIGGAREAAGEPNLIGSELKAGPATD